MTLFCGYTGLFCGYIGLFCRCTVLFCRDTEQANKGCAIPLYPHKRDRYWSAKEPYVFHKRDTLILGLWNLIGPLLQIRRALLRMDRALLRIHRSLLRIHRALLRGAGKDGLER